MKRRVFFILLFFGMLFSLSPSQPTRTHAQNDFTRLILGEILDGQNSPVEGVEIVARTGDEEIGKTLSQPDGTFILQDLDAVGLKDLPPMFNWVTSADFNGDGHPDLLSSDPFEPGGFYALNNGDGTFSLQDRTVAGLPVELRSQEPGVADFDQDGDLDVFLTNAYALNKGEGAFILLR